MKASSDIARTAPSEAARDGLGLPSETASFDDVAKDDVDTRSDVADASRGADASGGPPEPAGLLAAEDDAEASDECDDDGDLDDDLDDDLDADERGFTLLEVLIAVAILAMSLTSLLASQLDSMRALRYANGLTLAAYLAEYQLIEIEWKVRREGWVRNDLEYDGDFGDLDHDEIRYECLVDFVEIPEFSAILNAQSDARAESDGGSGSMMMSAGGQAFGAAGMVWPMIKAAIENSVRKASCKAIWTDGLEEHVVEVQTFWTDVNGLTSMPGMGGEFTGADDDSGEDTGKPGTGTGTGAGGGGGAPSRPQGLGGLGGL